jgi:mannose/cellobiose epimerase-like protein (N-acyl-D-glucosamine 2-epimerase family)
VAGNAVGSMAEARAAIERILTENIVPFWFARLRDPDGNGYRLNHDPQGAWKGPAPKRLVKQARVLWFLSRLKQSGFAPPECDGLAAAGFAFLRERLWDDAHGGFYWELDDRGSAPTMPDKHIYGHAHALYGVSQYALATGDPAARAFADAIFALLEERFHDFEYDGYHEFFRRDWTPYAAKDYGYLGAPSPLKLLNSHMHMMEAVAVYDELSGGPLARQRLIELIDIVGRRAIREPYGALTDQFNRDWTPLRGPAHDRVSYGHDAEAVHLLSAARARAGLPATEALATQRRLFDQAWLFGHDRRHGGVYAAGALGQAADDLRKLWWAQAEAMRAALELYRLTGEEAYATAFYGTLDWIMRRQIDWEHGDWHAEIGPDGKPSGDKAGIWKGPYHNGRAMIEAMAVLEAMR